MPGWSNCELAQAFRRLGSEVDLVGNDERLLPAEAPAASEVVAERLAAEGVRLHLGVSGNESGRWAAATGD